MPLWSALNCLLDTVSTPQNFDSMHFMVSFSINFMVLFVIVCILWLLRVVFCKSLKPETLNYCLQRNHLPM